jgi:hypothetical protein
MQLVLSRKSPENSTPPYAEAQAGHAGGKRPSEYCVRRCVLAPFASAPERTATSLNLLPNLPKPEKEFSKALIPGKTIIGTMRGRMLVCIVLGLLAVTPALAPASERAGNSPMGTPEGWSEDIDISNDPAHQDTVPEMAVSGSNVHAVWLNDYKNVYYSKSNNEGANWITPISLYNATSNCQYPDIGVNNNSVHVVWSRAYRIFYRNSTNNGDTWNQMKFISNDTSHAIGPRLFLNENNVHVIWYDQRDGSSGEVYYRRSLDGGITWDNGQGIDEDRRISFSPSVIGMPRIAGYQSNISITWEDERNGDFEIYWMISKDNGYTWEDGLGNVGLDRRLTFTGGICDYAIGVNGSNIYLAWIRQVWPGPTYTLYYCNSSNNGLTWSSAQVLSGPSPVMVWPDINAYNTNVSIVWQDARDDGTHEQIYIKNSTDGGSNWGSDIRLTYDLTKWSVTPKLRKINDITHLIWLNQVSTGDVELMYKRSPDFPTPAYTIPLQQGWNLLSTPLVPEDESINKVLENITGKWDYIQLYNSTDSDHWKTNLTYRPEQLNDLNSLDYRMGFWINITEPGVFLTLKGQLPDNTVIPLKAGWNLVGYPTLNDTMTVGNALWGTGADRVQVFDAADPYRLKEVGSTYIMKPGEGYWVHVPADTTWVVDW